MAAGLGPLDHERVGARGRRHARLLGLVTVTHTSLPAARRRATTSGGGQPNVNDTTATGSAEQRELGVPVVVVEARLAQRRRPALGLAGQAAA